VLEVGDLRVEYGGVVAIDGVSLAIERGEIVSVLGPSGSGKSTLLRAVAGLEPLTAGRVSWDGADLAGVPTHQRGFGLMFQDHALFPHRDVLGNVAFGLRMPGRRAERRPSEIESRSREVLASTGLAGYEHRNVYELSGGEQQRVALARALAPNPRLLMLDEPLGSLDRLLRERLVQQLRELFTELGATVLAVTHDHEEAFALADRVVIMREGGIEDVGRADELWRRPATRFAAEFLGFENRVDATVVDGIAASPWGPVAASSLPDGPAVVMARAGGFRLDDAAALRGEVTGRLFRRDHFLLRIATGHGAIEVAVDPGDVPPEGSLVGVALRDGAGLAFPQA